MSDSYTIRAGDTLSRIARQNGYPSWRVIYNHPDNAGFRRLRPDPNQIQPGDTVVLPPKPSTPPHASLMLPWNLAELLQVPRPLRLIPVPLTELPTLGPALANPTPAFSAPPRSTSGPALWPLTFCGPVADTPPAPLSGQVHGGYGTAGSWTANALLKCGPITDPVLDWAWRTAPLSRRAFNVSVGVSAATIALVFSPSREFVRGLAHNTNLLGMFGVRHVGLAPRLGIHGDWGAVINFNLEQFSDVFR